MSGEDPDLEDLKQATSRGDRASGSVAPDDRDELVEGILAHLEEIDAGDRQKTVSVWDGKIAALVAALEEDADAREELGTRLASAFDLEDAPTDRPEILRLALRLGIREAAPDYFDAVRDAVERQARRSL